MYITRRQMVIGAAVAAITVVVGLGVLLLASQKKSGPFPASIRAQANFPLYYPTELPDGLSVDKSSISATEQTVAYTISGKKAGSSFAVSIQPLPADFDFIAFKKKFFTTDEFTTEAGTVLVGEVGSSLVASIRTNDGSWILINTPYDSSQAELTALSRQFIKVSD